jgi:hypothetical protein
MAATDPEVLLNLKSITGLSKLGKLNQRLASAPDSDVRSRVHLRVVNGRSYKVDIVTSDLSAEHVNQCMLLLLVICVVLACFILGAVACFGTP